MATASLSVLLGSPDRLKVIYRNAVSTQHLPCCSLAVFLPPPGQGGAAVPCLPHLPGLLHRWKNFQLNPEVALQVFLAGWCTNSLGTAIKSVSGASHPVKRTEMAIGAEFTHPLVSEIQKRYPHLLPQHSPPTRKQSQNCTHASC